MDPGDQIDPAEIFDLRFTEIENELGNLFEWLELLENNLPRLIQDGTKRILDDYESDDPADQAVCYYLEAQLKEGVTTRFLIASPLLAAWAIYETAVSELAGYVRKKKEVVLKINNLQGSFLEKARLYFDEVLRFDLHPIGTDWDRLKRIAALRHAFAHANGRMAGVKDGKRKRIIEKWVEANEGLKVVDDDYLVINLTLVRQELEFIAPLIRNLAKRVRIQF